MLTDRLPPESSADTFLGELLARAILLASRDSAQPTLSKLQLFELTLPSAGTLSSLVLESTLDHHELSCDNGRMRNVRGPL